MEGWLHDLFFWLPEGWTYYTLLFVVALLESVILVGLLVPGSIITIFAGFLALHGKGDLAAVMTASALGALFGDMLSYALGARLGPVLLDGRWMRRRRDLIRRAELFFVEHGGKSVFFGRFIGPMRGFLPFIAGSARMSPAAFGMFALVSAVIWGIVYPGLGYLGGASWQRVQVLAGRLSLIIALLVFLVVLNTVFWKRIAPRLARSAARGWERVSRAWSDYLQSPAARHVAETHPRLWNWISRRFSPHLGSGLYLTFGFFVSAFFAIFFVTLSGEFGWTERMDLYFYALVSTERHPAADVFLALTAALADAPVLLCFGFFVLFWLLLNNREISALFLLAGVIGGELLLLFLHFLFQRPGPIPFITAPSVYFTAFPSGHAFSATLLVGMSVYFILGSYTEWQARLKLVMTASFLVLLMGLSRVYLGLQWLSSVMAGYALAALWLTFLVTASELRRRYAGELPWRSGWQPVRLRPAVRRAILLVAALATVAASAVYLAWRLEGLSGF
jgi:membrane protein DedA with SNARE-associated domain/membrane-associated phospholipid phosphatase